MRDRSALADSTCRLLPALTDGYISVPPQAPDYPVIWCLTRKGRKPTDWGQELWLSE